MGFNFCVALRKLPIITAAERKQSPNTAVLQLCRLQSAAGRGCGPGWSGRRGAWCSSRFPAGWPGCQEPPLSIIVPERRLGKSREGIKRHGDKAEERGEEEEGGERKEIRGERKG